MKSSRRGSSRILNFQTTHSADRHCGESNPRCYLLIEVRKAASQGSLWFPERLPYPAL